MRSLRAIGLVLFTIAAIALPQKSHAFLGSDMDAVHATLDRFFFQYGGARELANSAAGILVFPSVVKAGFGFGGEYGEGALLIQGRPVATTTPCRLRSASSSGPKSVPLSSCL